MAWTAPAGSGINIYYKLSGFTYSFKDANTTIQESVKDWSVYPNPATEVLLIQGPTSVDDQGSYELVDMTGHSIMNGVILTNKQEIRLSSLVPGTYVLKLSTSSGIRKTEILVKN